MSSCYRNCKVFQYLLTNQYPELNIWNQWYVMCSCTRWKILKNSGDKKTGWDECEMSVRRVRDECTHISVRICSLLLSVKTRGWQRSLTGETHKRPPRARLCTMMSNSMYNTPGAPHHPTFVSPFLPSLSLSHTLSLWPSSSRFSELISPPALRIQSALMSCTRRELQKQEVKNV